MDHKVNTKVWQETRDQIYQSKFDDNWQKINFESSWVSQKMQRKYFELFLNKQKETEQFEMQLQKALRHMLIELITMPGIINYN